MKPEAHQNIVRFKEALLRHTAFDTHKDRRSYRLFFNQSTGDMRFEKAIQNASRDWKEAHLIVRERQNHVVFQLCDEKGQPFRRHGLAALAWKVACDMLAALNGRAERLGLAHAGALPEEQVADELASEPLSAQESLQESIETLAGWQGALSRIEAEERLAERPRGTYLLRDGDELDADIAARLSEANHTLLHFYVLTAVAGDGKIVDLSLLQADKGWTVYRDNPNLSDSEYTYYPTARALIAHLHPIARSPCFSR